MLFEDDLFLLMYKKGLICTMMYEYFTTIGKVITLVFPYVSFGVIALIIICTQHLSECHENKALWIYKRIKV